MAGLACYVRELLPLARAPVAHVTIANNFLGVLVEEPQALASGLFHLSLLLQWRVERDWTARDEAGLACARA
jgi:hypothetical protein